MLAGQTLRRAGTRLRYGAAVQPFTSISANWSLGFERGGHSGIHVPKDKLEHPSQHCSLPVSLCAGRLWAVRGLLILTSMVANVDVKLSFAEY